MSGLNLDLAKTFHVEGKLREKDFQTAQRRRAELRRAQMQFGATQRADAIRVQVVHK